METPALPTLQSFVGTWRRFGETGPVYEIIGIHPPASMNDHLMRIRIVETEEELDYPFEQMIDDPTAD